MAIDQEDDSALPVQPPTVALPQDGALGDAVKVLGDAMKNEESRFSNLNTRAVSVVSATSLITALAGFFSKDLLGTAFDGWGRTAGKLGLLLTLIGLVATTLQIVVWVLLPRDRMVFGDNKLVDSPASLATGSDVNQIAFSEYLIIYTSLVARNTEKAKALNKGYIFFLTTVSIIAATVALVVASTF